MTTPIPEEITAAIALLRASGYRVIKRPAPDHPAETIADVLRRRAAGMSDRKIARALGMTKGQVAGIIWRHKTKKG